MKDKYILPFYKYPNPPHNRVSPKKLNKVYSEKVALYYCGEFNLEDNLEKLPIIVLRDKDKIEYKILYRNPDSIHHLRIIKNVNSIEYAESEIGRDFIVQEIKELLKTLEAKNE